MELFVFTMTGASCSFFRRLEAYNPQTISCAVCVTEAISGANTCPLSDAVRQMLDEHPHTFRYLIPSGAVIESLRLSEVNNPPMDFTRDGYHMDFGAGRYALACTWYEVLIRPFTHRTMRNNSLLSIWGDMKVDDRMASYCRQAAWRAARGPRRKVFEARAVTKPARARWKGHIDVVSQDMTIYEK